MMDKREYTKEVGSSFFDFLRDYFDLKKEKENEYETIESFKHDVDFRGAKAWVLICAILIASLGLNVNSIAVIIGAMLISPLMGPIIGLGLGLGITDFDLVKRSLKNFAIATLIAVLTSAVYFFLTPITTAQSELLARTQPTIFDVLIAFTGGLAGILAGATKSKGNVIPGVAIATALMPPLCTAGYGLATWQLNYFLGAFYLYTINSVFIGLATFLMIKLLKYPQKSFVDKVRETRLHYLVTSIVLFTAVPSIFLGYQLIQRTYFEQQERTFVEKEFNFPNTQLIRHKVSKAEGRNLIELTLIGEELPESVIESIRSKIPDYGLRNTALVVRQGFGNADLDAFRMDLLHDVKNSSSDFIHYQQMKIDSLSHEISQRDKLSDMALSLTSDLKELYPEVVKATFSKSFTVSTDSLKMQTIDNVTIFATEKISPDSRQRIERWIRQRIPGVSVGFETK